MQHFYVDFLHPQRHVHRIGVMALNAKQAEAEAILKYPYFMRDVTVIVEPA